MTLPVPTGGLLARLHDYWAARGWHPDALERFRMEGEDDPLADFSDEERTVLEGLPDAERQALLDLTDEQRAELIGNAEDPRIKQARDQAVKQRRELKPWKDLGKELGMTPDEIRAALVKKKLDPKKDDPPDPPDEEEIRRVARREAAQQSARRIVRSEVRVHAAGLFADPQDAPLYVDLEKYDVDDDGDIIDVDELIEDLKQVLVKKPHLAKKRRTPAPDKGQGKRGDVPSGADAGRAEAERRFGKKEPAKA